MLEITLEETQEIVDKAIDKAVELYKKGDNEQAAALFKQILCVDEEHVVALQMLGLIESRQPNKSEDAIQKLLKAKELDPENADVYNNLGLVYSWSDAKNMELAEENYRRSIELNPAALHFYSNLGIHLKSQGREKEAEDILIKGLMIDEASTMLHFNYATLLGEQKRWEEAKYHYGRAIELDPSFASAHYNLATVYLTEGNFKDGGKEYEWRWESYPEFKRIYTRFPEEKRWDGKEPISGKRMFLYAEQGMGDTIQFSRFIKNLRDMGAYTIFEEHSDLVNLMKTLDGPDEITTYGAKVAEFDYHCSIVSLPYLLGLTDINKMPNKPYLKCNYADLPNMSICEEKYWLDYPQFRIGIVWGGNPVHRHDPWRSTYLRNFRRLQGDKVKMFSLQKDSRVRFWPGFGEKDLTEGAEGMSVVDLSDFMIDYNATAALIDRMDLIIAVDTATAHLAGAMGKPVWLLTAYHNDWRWLASGKTTQWYPNMKIYRQPKHGDWESVFDEVNADLKDLLAEGGRPWY